MTRKVFQELQTSAYDRSVFVGSPKRTSEFQKVTQNSVKVKMSNIDKENVTVRRSKRKGAIVESLVPDEQLKKTVKGQAKKTSKEQPVKSTKKVTKKSAAKNAKTKKENTASTSEAETAVLLNQSRLDSFLSPLASSSTTVMSGVSNVLDSVNTTVNRSITEETNLMTSDTPTRSYWQIIAEERQAAIEKTLLENEWLTDQIDALQSENSQLKNALAAAEKVLQLEGLLE